MHLKNLVSAAISLVMLIGVQAASAQSLFPVASVSGTETVAHGGGCRKDSPPGQCCHAGSQPFHCH